MKTFSVRLGKKKVKVKVKVSASGVTVLMDNATKRELHSWEFKQIESWADHPSKKTIMSLSVGGESYDFTGQDAPKITMAVQSAVMAAMAAKALAK